MHNKKDFKGKFVLIYKGQIIANTSTLNEIYLEIDKKIPKDERCRIKYVYNGSCIY